jgi:hypothetical protein
VTAVPAWTEDELGELAEALAERTPGVQALLPVVARRSVLVFRRDGALEVTVRLVVGLDPAPVVTVRTFGRELRDAIRARTGLTVLVELGVADIRP